MFSFRTASILTSCAAGAGYYIGRFNNRCNNYVEDSDDKQCQLDRLQPRPIPAWENKLLNFIPSATVHAKSDLQVTTVGEQSLVGQQNRTGEIVRHGFPSLVDLHPYEDFILSYDKRTRVANWVLEHLTPEKVNKQEGADRAKMKFKEEESIHNFHRATNKDYQGSGYDRGHLAAAANHRQSESAMSQTFFLSNIAPQVGEGFNRDAWNNLEKYVRAIARKAKNVYVCTGPLYLPRKEPDGKLYVKYEVIGVNHVAVPTHFFKVLVIENESGKFDLQSYVMPNQSLPNVKLHHYLMPLEMIERAAGLNFFQNIPKNSFRKINAKPSS